MTSIHSIDKWNNSFIFLAYIDDVEATNEYQNQIINFFKPWEHKELITLPPFGNAIDEEMDNEMAMIDKDYDRVSNMVRFLWCHWPKINPKKVHYYLMWCTKLKKTLMQEYKDPSNYTYAIGYDFNGAFLSRN